MANSATLAIRIVSDAKGASKGFDDAERRVGGFTAGLDRASVAAGGVLAGVGLLATEAFNSASALQQAGGAVESVFGANAAAVKAYAADAADAVGLANSDYSNLAALLGAQLNGMGVAADQLVPKSNDLIKMGADLAATFGGTTQDAVNALSSALKGETDPIERYGISIKQADVNARLAQMGLSGLEGQAAKTAQAQAVMALITDQGAAANGAFAREADTAAGQQQRMAAQAENAKAALGEALLPIVAKGSEMLASLALTVSENSTAFTIIAGVIAGVAAAILLVNGGIKAYRAAVVVATAMQWLWNVAMSANPIGLIILAVAGLIGLGVLLYNKFKPFRDLIDTVVGFFKKAWEWAQKLLSGGIVGVVSKIFGAPGGGGGRPGGGGGDAPRPGLGTSPTLRGAAPAPLRGASAGGGLGGGSSSAVAASTPTTVVHITVQGAIDPLGTARTIRDLLDNLDTTTGLTVALSAGMPR